MRKIQWKCPDCGMIERKEPHRTLIMHMDAVHGKRWSESDGRFITPAGLAALAEFDAAKQKDNQ